MNSRKLLHSGAAAIALALATTFTATLAGCSNEELLALEESQTPAPDAPSSTIRSIEEVLTIANVAAEMFDKPTVRSRSCQAGVEPKVSVIKSHGSESRSNASDTLIYVVEYGNDNGFALIGAPQGSDEILAVIDSGSYDSMETLQNDGFQFFLDAAKAEMMASTTGMIGGTITPGAQTWRTEIKWSIPTKLSVKWGKKYPEGLFCPNLVAGCVPTAMAQILSYFEQPQSISLTYPDHDKDILQLDWCELKKHIQAFDSYDENLIANHTLTCEASEEAHLDLARLCRQLGHAINATYHTEDRTSGFPHIARTYLSKLLPESQISSAIYLYVGSHPNTDKTYPKLYQDIHDGIVFMFGDSTEGAHVWVADGGRAIQVVMYQEVIGEIDPNTGQTLYEIIGDQTTYYYHFNWGFCGNANGYFKAGVFDTTKPTHFTQPNGLPDPEDDYTPPGYGESHDFCSGVYYYVFK